MSNELELTMEDFRQLEERLIAAKKELQETAEYCKKLEEENDVLREVNYRLSSEIDDLHAGKPQTYCEVKSNRQIKNIDITFYEEET